MGVITEAIQVRVSGSSPQDSLRDVVSLTKQLCEDFDFDLDQAANQEQRATEAAVTEFCLDLLETLQMAQGIDPGLWATLRERSLRAAEVTHAAADGVAGLRGWST